MKKNLNDTWMRCLIAAVLIFQWNVHSYGDPANPLLAKVDGFFCKNVTVSEAISLLSKRSPVQINSIIDDVQEPLVNIPERQGMIGDFLKEILTSMPNYDVLLKQGTILILPKGLENDKAFPLNQILNKFTVRYNTYKTAQGEPVYKCEFIDRQGSLLNVVMGVFVLPSPSDFSKFPTFVNFENQTLLDILTSISLKEKISWCCAKLRPSHVQEMNQMMVKVGVEKAWQNENAPCYQIFWGRGGFHGEDRETEARELKKIQTYWARHAAIKKGRDLAQESPLNLTVSTGEKIVYGSSIPLTFKLTNRSSKKVSFANPFLDGDGAFFIISRYVTRDHQFGEYRLTLPKGETVSEPKVIVLAPRENFERTVDVRDATLTFNQVESDPEFKGEEHEKFDVGDYLFIVSMYFKDETGKSYSIDTGGSLDFKIDRRSDKIQ